MTPCLDKAIQAQNAQQEKEAKAAEADSGFEDALPSLFNTSLRAEANIIDLSSSLFTPDAPIAAPLAEEFLTSELPAVETLETNVLTEINLTGAKLVLKAQQEKSPVGNANAEGTHIKIDADGNITSCTAAEAVVSELSATIITESKDLDAESKQVQLQKTAELEEELAPIIALQKELDEAKLGVTLKIEVDLTEELLEEIGEEAAEAFVSEIKENIAELLIKDAKKEEEKEVDLHSCQFDGIEHTQAQQTIAYSQAQQNKIAREAANKEAILRKHEAKVLESLGLNDRRLLLKRLEEIDKNRGRSLKGIDNSRAQTLKKIDNQRAQTLKAIDQKRAQTLKTIDAQSSSAVSLAA